MPVICRVRQAAKAGGTTVAGKARQDVTVMITPMPVPAFVTGRTKLAGIGLRQSGAELPTAHEEASTTVQRLQRYKWRSIPMASAHWSLLLTL